MIDAIEETTIETVETVHLTDAAVATVRSLLVEKNVPDYGSARLRFRRRLLRHAIWHGA